MLITFLQQIGSLLGSKNARAIGIDCLNSFGQIWASFLPLARFPVDMTPFY
jgi:hypothetical protein